MTIEEVKKNYQPGTRLRLLLMEGENLPIGTEGTVRMVDDIGTIHVNWDNGSSLGLIRNLDKFEVI